jgi:hypothetical protein
MNFPDHQLLSDVMGAQNAAAILDTPFRFKSNSARMVATFPCA